MKSDKEKSFRIVILSNQVPYEGQAIITNSPNAWGSDNGKVGCVPLSAVKLNEENGYLAAFDLDFSESRWEEFVTKYTASRKLYFCIRREKAAAQDSEFYVYAYETTAVKILDGNMFLSMTVCGFWSRKSSMPEPERHPYHSFCGRTRQS